MKFTYDEYEKLVLLLREEQYVFCDYHSFDGLSKCVIMRHDVDMDLEKAVQLARLERTLGVKATYYVLISSDFYNIYSKRNIEMIKEIQSLGHTIGLHYDEQRYSE
ncbi:MAG: hypothetical protein J6A25_03980, partial [Lachnospiraceae bacterium]|nr:hypothetical protein [Lachnospiraceae bacterium]